MSTIESSPFSNGQESLPNPNLEDLYCLTQAIDNAANNKKQPSSNEKNSNEIIFKVPGSKRINGTGISDTVKLYPALEKDDEVTVRRSSYKLTDDGQRIIETSRILWFDRYKALLTCEKTTGEKNFDKYSLKDLLGGMTINDRPTDSELSPWVEDLKTILDLYKQPLQPRYRTRYRRGILRILGL